MPTIDSTLILPEDRRLPKMFVMVEAVPFWSSESLLPDNPPRIEPKLSWAKDVDTQMNANSIKKNLFI